MDRKTWTIACSVDGGERERLAAMEENEARALHAGIIKHIDPGAELIDLLAEARRKFPVGSRVRHTTTGGIGTVEAVEINDGQTILEIHWEADGRFSKYVGDFLEKA